MSIAREKLIYVDTNLTFVKYEHTKEHTEGTLVNNANVTADIKNKEMVVATVEIESFWDPQGPFRISCGFDIYFSMKEPIKTEDIDSSDVDWLIGPAQRYFSMILANLTQLSFDIPFIWNPKKRSSIEKVEVEETE